MANSSTANLVHMEVGVSKGGSQLCPSSPQSEKRKLPRRNLAHPTTDAETLVHLLKGSLGTGILTMPLAFKHSGLIFGVFATAFVGLVSTYCVNILVQCAHHLCQRRKLPSLNYDAVAEISFLEGPPRLRKFGPLARFLVNFFLVLDLYGCCCLYVVFVSKNIKQVVDLYLSSEVHLELWVYMLCCLPPLILMNLIRSLKYLAPLSMVANVLMGFGFGITFYYVMLDLPPIDSRPAFSSLGELPIFFGTAIFALEGIGVVMPLENNMETPEHFVGCPGVLNIGMTVVVSLYCVVGFLGYLRYGPITEGSITLNLPDELLAQSVKIMIAVAIFFTYSLQFYPPFQVIWSNSKHRFASNPNLAEYTLRIVLVSGTVLVAILVPNLGPLTSLVGAVCLSFLGLMFPSVLELVVFWDEPGGLGKGYWVLWKNILVICFGIVGFFTGSYCSLLDIFQDYSS